MLEKRWLLAETKALANSDPDLACRRRYGELLSEVQEEGLNAGEIEKSKTIYSISEARSCWIKAEAYKPTGVALGCPLPDRKTTFLFWRLSRLAMQWLGNQTGNSNSFAFVPKDWYHVTIANWSHFDLHRDISEITETKVRIVNEVLKTNPSSINIRFAGLLITRAGRLIVPGYPTDGLIFRLRRELVARIPELSINLPVTAHIKLGHLLYPLNHEKSIAFQKWLTGCGKIIDRTVSFSSIHTPIQDIALSNAIIRETQ
jgi:hypothetical protein